MVSIEKPNRVEQLKNLSYSLEEQAGISRLMERAREGRFIPLGAMGESATPDEYFADEHDYFRGKIRDAYFSVQDIELRKDLIVAQRENESYVAQSFVDDIQVANREVSIAKNMLSKEPWTKAAIVAIATVGIGYVIFDLVGAIGGAVGGFFLGQGCISKAKSEAIFMLEQANNNLQQSKKDQTLRALWPECFTLNEEITGAREVYMDRELAYANVLQESARYKG